MKQLFKNANIILPDRIINGNLEVENGKIVSVNQKRSGEYDEIIDIENQYLCPGFVEIHTHGAGGADFMDGTEEAYLTACRTHLKHGTTTIYPTLLASSNEELEASLTAFEKVRELLLMEGITAPGVHMEGPYLNRDQRGAINEKYIHSPLEEEYKSILNNHDRAIARWTIAPELDGAMQMGDTLYNMGIIASIGHSNALYSQVLQAIDHGFTHVTHLYSAMSTIIRRYGFRYSGVLESVFCLPCLTAEIIADGCHLPPEIIKMLYDLLGVKRICFCCDSMRCAGEDVKESFLGSYENGIPVIIEDEVAKLCDRSAFAGSIATDDRLVQTAVKKAHLQIYDAVRMMSLTPAEIMHIDAYKGSIEVGKDADFVVLDDNLMVKAVYATGKAVVSQL